LRLIIGSNQLDDVKTCLMPFATLYFKPLLLYREQNYGQHSLILRLDLPAS
jgi:hypothetical protein